MKKSEKAQANGFKPNLLKKEHERLYAACKKVNSYFDNKHFEVKENGYKGEIYSKGYCENMDVYIDPDFSKVATISDFCQSETFER